MTDRFSPGTRVQTCRTDPSHHSRLPRYARGAVGTILEPQGQHPLADDRVRGLPCDPLPVYTVRFAARDLFDEGEHSVTLDIWESNLMPVEGAEVDQG